MTGAAIARDSVFAPHGLVDALRSSTTERVVREARCPVLAIPIAR